MGPDLPMGPPSLRGDWRQGAEPLCRRTQLSQKRCKELECLEGQKCWKQWNPMVFQGSEKEVCLFDCEPGFEWTEYSCGCKKKGLGKRYVPEEMGVTARLETFGVTWRFF